MRVIRYKTDQGQRTAIHIGTGNKYHQLLVMDTSIRLQHVPIFEERYFTDLMYKGKPYPVARAKRIFKRAVKRLHGNMKNVSKPVREALS